MSDRSTYALVGGGALLLLIASQVHAPYSFYVLLRFVICGGAIYLFVSKRAEGRKASSGVFLASIAVLYNPILPIRMHREDWQIVNVVSAVLLLAWGAYVWQTSKRDRGPSSPS
jgi:hypothetical protein